MEEKTGRQKEIIRAAKNLFAKKGYSATSMDEIAKEIGITKASLYYFFESKERIFAEIIEDVLAELRNYLAAEIEDLQRTRPAAGRND